MILTDSDLLSFSGISVEPLGEKAIQPASIDVRLSNEFLVFTNQADYDIIDPLQPLEGLLNSITVEEGEAVRLHPQQFILGSTIEKVTLPLNIVGRIEGRSSLGRLGLIIHATAGYIDPGFSGKITLEILNVSPLPIRLTPGMKIGQISFSKCLSDARHAYGHPEYGSKYQGQDCPTASKYFIDTNNP